MRSHFSRIILAAGVVCFLAASNADARPQTQATAPPAAQPVPQSDNLATQPSAKLMKIYEQLRHLAGSDESAPTENVNWKKDAATFHFAEGQMTLAAPVAGHVVGAVFNGTGTFKLVPPTAAERHQISRFTGSGQLVDTFHKAVFFFTDNSAAQLMNMLDFKPRGNATATGKVLDATLAKYEHNFNAWENNLVKGNFSMRNLSARMLADMTDATSRGFFLADFKGQHSGSLLFVISWNRPTFVLPSLANDEQVALIHYAVGRYWEWWAGFHLTSEYAKTAHPVDPTLVAHCSNETIDAVINKHHRISATATMQVEVPSAPLRLLPLDLDGVLRIQSVTDGSGHKLAFIQEGRKLDSDPWVILPQPARPHHPYTLKITYAEDSTTYSHIIFKKGSGLYYVTARESWYPNFGAFNDRTQFHLLIESPKNFKLVATGRLVKSEKEHGMLVTQWESQIPFPAVGFNYGYFVSKTDSGPKLKVTAYAGKKIPNELAGLQDQLDLASMESGRDAAAHYGILTGGFNTASSAEHTARVSYQAMHLFEHYFGQLPFKNISVSEQPIRGYGQSWPTLIFLPYDALLDATTRDNLHLQETAGQREFYNIVPIHEMSHQWWGSMVGWRTYRDQWLSEGFAQFSAALYLQAAEPSKWNDFWDLMRRTLLHKDRAGVRPVDIGPIVLNTQLNAYLEPNASEDLIYDKGPYILEMLRMLMRNPRSKDPDVAFIAMMNDFTKTYEGKNPSTADFERIVNKHVGHPMNWFFNEWVYGTTIPTYNFSYHLKNAGNGKTAVYFTLQQSGVPSTYQMDVPIYVKYKKRTIRIALVKMTGDYTGHSKFILPVHPSNVSIDATRALLAYIKEK